MSNPIDPDHYKKYSIEPIDVIESWELGWPLSNVIKYIARARYKGKELEDLKKARWYLDRKIEHVEYEKQYEFQDSKDVQQAVEFIRSQTL